MVAISPPTVTLECDSITIKEYHQMVPRNRLQRLVQVAVGPTEQTRCVEDLKS